MMGEMQLYKVTITVGISVYEAADVTMTVWVMTEDPKQIRTEETEHRLGGKVKEIEHIGDITEV